MEDGSGVGEIIWTTQEEACAMAALLLILRNVFALADVESYNRITLIELMDECIRRQELGKYVQALDDQIEEAELDGSL